MMQEKHDMVNSPSHYNDGVEDLKKAQWYLNKLIEVYDDDKS